MRSRLLNARTHRYIPDIVFFLAYPIHVFFYRFVYKRCRRVFRICRLIILILETVFTIGKVGYKPIN